MRLTKRVTAIKLSPTLAVTAKAAAMRAEGIDVIGLGAGEPDFPSAPAAKQAGSEAIHADKTHYTAVDGIPELKQAVVRQLAKDEKLSYTPEQFLISVGAKQELIDYHQALLRRNNSYVLITDAKLKPPIQKRPSSTPPNVSISLTRHGRAWETAYISRAAGQYLHCRW